MTRRPTLADVAARARVSPTAVSLVLNDRPGRISAEAVARIRQAAVDLDYRPNQAARSLRLGKTHTVAFLSADVTLTRFASAMIRGLTDAAAERDHTILIAETGPNAERAEGSLKALLDRKPDAVVIGLQKARRIALPPVPVNVPLVLLNCTGEGDEATVLPAEYEAGRAITRQLLDAGHRDIALLGWSPELDSTPSLSATLHDRFAGILDELAAAGVAPVSRYDGGIEWEPSVGFDGVQAVWDAGLRPTGLICLNDRIAFGAYQGLAERGLRVAADVSVVSFDDEVLAGYLRPGLTTAAIPYEEMGRLALELALARQPALTDEPAASEPEGAGEPAVRHVRVPMTLRVRESVRPV